MHMLSRLAPNMRCSCALQVDDFLQARRCCSLAELRVSMPFDNARTREQLRTTITIVMVSVKEPYLANS